MPICEADPWRLQYFEQANCPPDVFIPTEDSDAWLWYPEHRWVYDKIAVAQSQGLDAAPHGVPPPRFPVFSKPITNLKGMGIGSRILTTAAEYEANVTAGHMWMPLLEGRHVSSDVAVVDGEPHWWRHVTGAPSGEGTFDHWTVHAARDAEVESYCGAWIRRHLARYSGILNIETIGGRMIEVHLRMSDQWPDLYGAGWVDAVVRLYQSHDGTFRTRTAATASASFSLSRMVPIIAIRRRPWSNVCGACRGFRACRSPSTRTRTPGHHAMPPGGFRLAVVNAWNLAAGQAGRDVLRRDFQTRALARPA